MASAPTTGPTTKRLTRASLVALLVLGGSFTLAQQTSAASEAVTISAAADAYTSSAYPNKNFGSAATLRTDGTPQQSAYVKFHVPGPVVTATLRLFATTDNAKGVDAFQTSSTKWSENSLTHTNKPTVGARVGTSGGIVANRWVDIDVTESITTAGDYSFALIAKDSHHVSYRSREAAANSPRLILELAGDPATTSTSSSATQPASTTSPPHPVEPATVRAAFYYPWFTETWGRSTDPFSVYHAGLGYYSSDDSAVLANHLATMQYANLNSAIVSWWGQGEHSEQTRVPGLLNAAAGTQFTEALYYEKEGFADPGVTELSADLNYIQQRYASHPNYLTRGGRPVLMAFGDADDGCSMASRWKQANAGRFFIVLKVFNGYRNCPDQPDGWHQYAPAVAQDSQAGFSYSVSPGFWLKGEQSPRLIRDPSRFATNLRAMVASGAPFQLITTFNEWGEGTAVEWADRMASGASGGWSSSTGRGTYVDLMHSILPATASGPTMTSSSATSTVTTSRSPTMSSPTSGSTTASSVTPVSTTPVSTTPVSTTPVSTTPVSTTPAPSATGQKILVIVDENHTQAQAQAGMPYLVSLQNQFGVTTRHTAPTHPSLPNYLVIAGGSTFGVTDDNSPASNPVRGQSVFGAAIAKGKTAKTYNDAMTANCQLSSSGRYAVKHNPWAYFVDERTQCQQGDLPLSRLAADVSAGALPTVGMLTPDMCNDGHDCSLATADAFLRNWVPLIMNGPDYRNGKLTIVITFDEGVGTSQTIETVVVNPTIHGAVITTPLTHASLSRWLYRVSGSTPLRDAASAVDFGAAFGL
ncbi:CBM96 family carbohydrate-binding protein [Nakamurella sp. GG22]